MNKLRVIKSGFVKNLVIGLVLADKNNSKCYKSFHHTWTLIEENLNSNVSMELDNWEN